MYTNSLRGTNLVVSGKDMWSDREICSMQVRYEERGSRDEEWLSLSKCRFAWQADLPAGSHPNPTFVPGLTPSGHDAVDHKV